MLGRELIRPRAATRARRPSCCRLVSVDCLGLPGGEGAADKVEGLKEMIFRFKVDRILKKGLTMLLKR
jgi:hypothetical protein